MIQRKYELYDAAFQANPYPTFAAMRQNDPILQQPGMDGETMIWFVTGYKEVDEMLRNDQLFTRDYRHVDPDSENNRPEGMRIFDQNMLARDGAEHRRLRSLVSKAFTPRRIANLRGRIQEIADELVDKVLADGTMELMDAYAFPLPITVIAELLGVPVSDQDKFRLWTSVVIAPDLEGEKMAETVQHLTDFVGYLREMFAKRAAEPQDDLISELLAVREGDDKLSEEEMLGMVMLLIIAGHETTVGLIANSVVTLLRHPEEMARLKAHPEEMPTAVEEFLRYESPVERAVNRWATQDVEFHGHHIKQGDPLILILGAANRADTHFTDGDRLDTTRKINQHLAFGKGIHYCLGAPLARLEGEIALNTLLRRLPNLRWNQDENKIDWSLVSMFRKPVSLDLAWDVENR